MTTTNIIRPEVTDNYTVLPNQLLGYGRYIEGLKPRDSAVLLYLFSRPPHWKIIAKDIVAALNISINTVYAALAVLQRLGIASFTRNKMGHTRWLVSIDPALYSSTTTPRTKNPREEICDVLTSNERAIIIEKTTTRCVKEEELGAKNLSEIDYINEPTVTPKVTLNDIMTTFESAVSAVEIEEIIIETEIISIVDEPEILVEPIIESIKESIIEKIEIIEPVEVIAEVPAINPEAELDAELPAQLTEVEKLSAKKTLLKASLDNIAYTVVLMALKAALNTGGIRSPIAYLNGLINKAKDGTLDTRKYDELQASKCRLNRSDEIRNLFAQHGDSILLDLVTKGIIHAPVLGYIQYDEVNKLGLVNDVWTKKYAEIQLQKMNKKISSKPFKMPFKKSAAETRTSMSSEEFEAKRKAQIEIAMAMLNQGT